MVHTFDEHTFGHKIHTKCNKFAQLMFFPKKVCTAILKVCTYFWFVYYYEHTCMCTLSHNIPQFERRKGRSAGPAAACGRPSAARPVPVTSPSPPVSRFKSAARGTVTVCTLSHNITPFERRKGRSAGPAAPTGQRRGPGRQAGPRAQSHHRVRLGFINGVLEKEKLSDT
jgi:hypothetical protein